MAATTSVIDTIASIEGASAKKLRAKALPDDAKRLFEIRFAGGKSGLLDTSQLPGSVWVSVLRNLQELGQPVYVEISSATGLVTQVLQPKLQPVGAIEPAENKGDVSVEFLNSHARHFLRRTHARYAAVLRVLREAQAKKSSVWVTETLNSHEIIDVSPSRRSDR